MTARMDAKCLTRNNFCANLSISLPSYHIFYTTPLATHMKSKATVFAYIVTAIFLAKIVNSILSSGIRNFKVRLDVFSIHSDYHKIFLWRKGNQPFLQQRSKSTLLQVHFSFATDSAWILFP